MAPLDSPGGGSRRSARAAIANVRTYLRFVAAPPPSASRASPGSTRGGRASAGGVGRRHVPGRSIDREDGETDAVSERFGAIKAALERKGTRIEDFDAAIAAHALAEGAVLVTANLDDMVRVPGLAVEDWAQ